MGGVGSPVEPDSYLCSPLVPAQPESAQSEVHVLASPGALSDASFQPEANAYQLCPPRLTEGEHQTKLSVSWNSCEKAGVGPIL